MPEATTEKVAVFDTATVALAGWVVMVGAVTVSGDVAKGAAMLFRLPGATRSSAAQSIRTCVRVINQPLLSVRESTPEFGHGAPRTLAEGYKKMKR